jgi:NAD(P)-dependent dehydrogenase (short-subunit alcohol dehydrogenase family)
MNQIAFAIEQTVHSTREITPDLCSTMHSGPEALPAISTLRVDKSVKNRITNRCSRLRVQASMVNKSVATISFQAASGTPSKSSSRSLPTLVRCHAGGEYLRSVSTLAYAAAKAAPTNYSRALSNKVSPKGVRDVAVSPGFTETDAATRMTERMADKNRSDKPPPEGGRS